MFSKKAIFGSLLGLGFLLGIATNAVAEMPTPSLEQTNQFHRIEQPLELKLGVTLGGMALIGLELWWFLFRKSQGNRCD